MLYSESEPCINLIGDRYYEMWLDGAGDADNMIFKKLYLTLSRNKSVSNIKLNEWLITTLK